ncbi:MAG: nucleotide exchange factor GrpE [candidate division WOR-3 bacterium]
MRRVDEFISFSREISSLRLRRELERANLDLKISLYNLLRDYEGLKRVMEVRVKQNEERTKERFIREIIPLLEDIDRLLNHINSLDIPENAKESVKIILRKVEHNLKNLGIEKVMPSVGDDFDPSICEALTVVNTGDVPKGKIAVVFEPGWRFEGRLIKPARVGVAN